MAPSVGQSAAVTRPGANVSPWPERDPPSVASRRRQYWAEGTVALGASHDGLSSARRTQFRSNCGQTIGGQTIEGTAYSLAFRA